MCAVRASVEGQPSYRDDISALVVLLPLTDAHGRYNTKDLERVEFTNDSLTALLAAKELATANQQADATANGGDTGAGAATTGGLGDFFGSWFTKREDTPPAASIAPAAPAAPATPPSQPQHSQDSPPSRPQPTQPAAQGGGEAAAKAKAAIKAVGARQKKGSVVTKFG